MSLEFVCHALLVREERRMLSFCLFMLPMDGVKTISHI